MYYVISMRVLTKIKVQESVCACVRVCMFFYVDQIGWKILREGKCVGGAVCTLNYLFMLTISFRNPVKHMMISFEIINSRLFPFLF